MRASEMRTRSVTPCAQELGRDRQVPPLGHARARRPGPALRSTITDRRVAFEVGIVDARGEVVDVLEDDRAALVREQRGLGGA